MFQTFSRHRQLFAGQARKGEEPAEKKVGKGRVLEQVDFHRQFITNAMMENRVENRVQSAARPDAAGSALSTALHECPGV